MVAAARRRCDEELAERDAEGMGDTLHRDDGRRGLTVFDLRDEARREIGSRREVAEGEPLSRPETAYVVANDLLLEGRCHRSVT